MPLYTVTIQPEAEKDLDEAYHYLEKESPGLGFELLESITEVVVLLEDNPMVFQKIYKDKRRAVVKRFGYNIIYKVIEFDVYLLAIMHGSRDPEKWKDRK